MGIPAIKAQFRAVSWFHSIDITQSLLTTTHTALPGSAKEATVIAIDAVIVFTISKYLRFPVRIVSKFTFDEQNKIYLHEDIWSFADLFSRAPLGLGWLYEALRAVNGSATSLVIERLVWIHEWLSSRKNRVTRFVPR